MSTDDVIRLSETLGRIDGKLDEVKESLKHAQGRTEGRVDALEGRLHAIELRFSRFIGYAVGAGAAGSVALDALGKLGLPVG